jgi:Protein of unknown function (DUF2934)
MAKLTNSAPIDEPGHEQLATIHEPTHAEIEVCACYRYLERGLQDGFDLDDWLAAEADLRANRGVLTAAA